MLTWETGEWEKDSPELWGTDTPGSSNPSSDKLLCDLVQIINTCMAQFPQSVKEDCTYYTAFIRELLD